MAQTRGNKNSSLVKRHLTAVVLLPAFVAYLYYLPAAPYFLVLLLAVGMVSMRELFVMYRVPSALSFTGVITGGILLYVFCLYPEYIMYGISAAVFAVILFRLFSAGGPSGAMSGIGPVVVGFFYVAVCLSFQWFLRDMNDADGLKYIFVLYMSVWFADSMAYYIGTYLGRNILCPSISPKKTVEGGIGSVLGGILGAVTANAIFVISGFSFLYAVAVGAVMGVTSLLGDLIESMFKRDAGVKDSGSIMPGHGGILDRIDGMLFSGPVLYVIVRYF